MTQYWAEMERIPEYVGNGYVLRVIRRGDTQSAMLAKLDWHHFNEADFVDLKLTNADADGDLAGLMQALMDAGWRAGVRPTSFCAEDVGQQRAIAAMREHIDSLKNQVAAQEVIIKHLLPK